MLSKSEPNYPKLKPPIKAVTRLYPYLSPAEQTEAADALRRYLDLVWRIYRRGRRQVSEESEKAEKFDENPFKR